MSNSLVPHLSAPPASREEMLTRQFYDWERRGRGWRVSAFPVELEPPFRGIYFYDRAPEPVSDDGRIPTFFSRLFGSGSEYKKEPSDFTESEHLARIAELDEPVVCDYYGEDFRELRIVLPKEQKIGKPFVDQLVTSATYCTHPISFEIIGTPEEIVVQMAATLKDLPQLRQQLSSYFPDARFRENKDGYLEYYWEDSDGLSQIVDFGLSNEFMIPLDTVSNLELDPLVSIIGALTELEYDEVGIFQVLFQKAHSNWASEITDAVRFTDGTPVFSDAPEMIPHAKRKLASPLYAAVIRVAAKANDKERLWQIVRGVSAGMAQLSTPASNELIPLSNDGYSHEYHEQALLRRLSFRCGMILNQDELISLVHPPSHTVRSAKLVRDDERTKTAPAVAYGNPLVLGENTHQGTTRQVTLSNDQRTKHIHLIGSTGSGKSTLLRNFIRQDMEKGHGLCLIDPHGDLVDAVVENVPDDRTGDVILFDPSDSEYPIGFNILQAHSDTEKTILSSDLVATFRRMSTSWGDVMDSVLANAILAFVESRQGGTLFELKRFLVEKAFRDEFLNTVADDSIRYFWQHEFPLIANKPQASILIRLDSFLRQKLIRNIVCQKETRLNFREIMDGRKILLIKLAQGLIGEEQAFLLGTLLVSKIYQTALSRQDSKDRPHFWLYMDEFQHFITPSMENILSGSRKYNLGLVLAHQEFRQLQSRSQDVAHSVLSNCYARICFRLGETDAEKLASGFSFFDAKALQNLGVGEAIARFERADCDFNLSTLPPVKIEDKVARERKTEITANTRKNFGRLREEVEQEFSTSRQEPLQKTEQRKTATRSESVPKPPRSVEAVPKAENKRKQPNEVPDDPAPPSFENESLPREKTQQHRYLQALVKRMAEDKGFRVTIEKPVLRGIGRIDVALESEAGQIACEISVTNEPSYELQNIQKCFAAGYERVVIISPDVRHLGQIRKTAKEDLSEEQTEKTEFLTPEEFHTWLEKLPSYADAEERKVKGFKVKLKMKPLDEKERKTRKSAISEVVFGALKRLKKKSSSE